MNNSKNGVLKRGNFSEDFVWGVATSAYQIEGAHDSDGRSPSIWDTFCEQQGNIVDGSSGAIACDHYNRLEQDLDIIQNLGVNAYRFSVSWSRVLPNGYGEWNEKGLDFYRRLIDGLKQRNIQPHLTLYHWDLPQVLHDMGGWENRQVCQYFSDYAQGIAERFGDSVVSIVTHNEPWVVAILGYESGLFAPGIKNRKIAMQVSHHLLLSHGMALQQMRSIGCQAKLGIVFNQSPIHPLTNEPKDIEKARIDDGLIIRWYMDPIFKGSYPQDILDFLGDDQPHVEPQDAAIIAQPVDFIGVNYYTRNFSSHKEAWDAGEKGLEVTDMGWEIYPQGLTELLCRLHQDYDLANVYITENGAAFKDTLEEGNIADIRRLHFIHDHIVAVQKAIEAGVPVKGYFAWSLVDNFEWASGYEKRFGLLYVDYATQERYFKDSAKWYQRFLGEKI